jgi:hypothetical protein
MVEGHGGAMAARKHRKKEAGRDQGQDITFKDVPPITYFLQLGLTF